MVKDKTMSILQTKQSELADLLAQENDIKQKRIVLESFIEGFLLRDSFGQSIKTTAKKAISDSSFTARKKRAYRKSAKKAISKKKSIKTRTSAKKSRTKGETRIVQIENYLKNKKKPANVLEIVAALNLPDGAKNAVTSSLWSYAKKNKIFARVKGVRNTYGLREWSE